MSFVFQPWQLLLFVFAGWVNRQQQEVIGYSPDNISIPGTVPGIGFS